MYAMLPFADEPLLTAYHNKAFPVGVIQANSNEDITLWLALKTVNCVFNTQSISNKFDLCLNDAWGVRANIIEQQGIYLKKSIIDSSNMDIIKLLKTLLMSNVYINGVFNERFISSKADYQIEDFDHDYLLVGCDDGGFYSVGYVKTGRFENFYISNVEMLEGIKNTKNEKISLNLFNCCNDSRVQIEYDQFTGDLERYLSDPFVSLNDEAHPQYYGISAIRRLNKYFLDELENGFVYMDRRYSKSLEEHKKMMYTSVCYFAENSPNKQYYLSQSYKVYELAKLIHRMGIKMTFVKDGTIYDKIEHHLKEMVQIELRYLPELKDELEKVNNGF